jgi:hypothetical protein
MLLASGLTGKQCPAGADEGLKRLFAAARETLSNQKHV